METRRARAALGITLAIPLFALLFGACDSTRKDPAPATSSAAAAVTQAPSAAAPAPSTTGAAPSPERQALCTRSAECYIEVARQAAKEHAGDTKSVDDAADRLRTKQNTRCLTLSEHAPPEALADCMKLDCKLMLKCVAKLGRAN